jgi:hypothetical protein
VMGDPLAGVEVHQCLVQVLGYPVLEFFAAIHSGLFQQIGEISPNPSQAHEIGAICEFFDDHWGGANFVRELSALMWRPGAFEQFICGLDTLGMELRCQFNGHALNLLDGVAHISLPLYLSIHRCCGSNQAPTTDRANFGGSPSRVAWLL